MLMGLGWIIWSMLRLLCRVDGVVDDSMAGIE